MRAMKDSGIEWIGEIPKNWTIQRSKYSFECHNGGIWGKNEADEEEARVCVRVADFNYPELSIIFSDNMTKRGYTKSEIQSSKLQKGDILLEKSGGGEQMPVGRSVIFDSDDEMLCANFIEWMRPNPKYSSRFINYWLASAYRFGNTKKDIKQTTGIQNLDIPAFFNEGIVALPLEEQSRIADYLDKKCDEIDALIAAKEKTNALLRERRQSIIYEAVTKGLDPTAPMKDSGIEWIGMIPEGWNVKKTKYCFSIIAGATPKTENSEYWDGDIAWITPANYKTEDVYVSAGRKSISDAGLNSCATTLIPANSLIFSKRAPVGLVAINSQPLCTNQGCLSCVPDEGIDAKFYYYAMSSCTSQYELLATGTTFKEISAEAFANFVLPAPEYDVQKRIADYLDTECAGIDAVVHANESTIEKLKEYRQSVIYEAVTGKIEIE